MWLFSFSRIRVLFPFFSLEHILILPAGPDLSFNKGTCGDNCQCGDTCRCSGCPGTCGTAKGPCPAKAAGTCTCGEVCTCGPDCKCAGCPGSKTFDAKGGRCSAADKCKCRNRGLR